MKLFSCKMPSPLGALTLVADEGALLEILWSGEASRFSEQAEIVARPKNEILKLTRKQLTEYFKGQRTEFEIPLSFHGTIFQQKVWKGLQGIGFGEKQSYRSLARRIGHPKAFRAVGSANGRNPLPIVVPCHRVIAADGTLGGYAGGLKVKEKLLALEKSLN